MRPMTAFLISTTPGPDCDGGSGPSRLTASAGRGRRAARRQRAARLLAAALLVCAAAPATAAADDWPEYRGAGRQGVWTETGILEEFPPDGLSFTWRVPIQDGYAGPAVAGGRVFVLDARPAGSAGMRMIERILCLDEENGAVLWSHEWESNYAGLQPLYAIGPRATPTVDGDRVYVQGAMGRLFALDVATGAVLWAKDYVADLGTEVPAWGMAGAPLVEDDLLICLAGAEPDGKVIAFDKHTGAEVWRALSSASEPGYNAPLVFDVGGVRQLIVWHPRAITSLDPQTGERYWEIPFEVRMGVTIASPARSGPYLLVSSFFNGSRMLRLNLDRPDASLVWRSEESTEVDTDKLHSMIGTPVIDGDTVYGIDSYGELRGLDARTGERLWESQALTVERARQATAFFVRNGDRYFINNDRGELIIARFAPHGLEVVSRTHLLEPTSPVPRRRELGSVLWSYPAYANRHIVMRNGREIVRASLEAPSLEAPSLETPEAQEVQRPNFSGWWTLDREATTLTAPAFSGGRGGADIDRLFITHAANDTVIVGPETNGLKAWSYTPGRAGTIPVGRDTTMQATARWNGVLLVAEGEQGDMRMHEVMSLSADGTRLTIEVTTTTPDGVVTNTLVYRRDQPVGACDTWAMPCRDFTDQQR